MLQMNSHIRYHCKTLKTLLFSFHKDKKWSLRVCLTWILLVITAVHFLRLSRPGRVVYTHPSVMIESTNCIRDKSNSAQNACCPNKSPLNLVDLGTSKHLTYMNILLSNSHVCDGGWTPVSCRSVQNVAIIIPYRDRNAHLRMLLSRIHPLLFHQNISYHIFVIEQLGDAPFNRGLLLNLGVLYSLKINPTFDCFIFHDVDLLPENSDNLYLCDNDLRHLSSAIDDFRYHPPFVNYAGGVTAMSKTNIFKINGFPTRFWGWGSEDDEFSARALVYGLKLTRPPEFIGRYKAPRHIKASLSLRHQDAFRHFRSYLHDGLMMLKDGSYDEIKPFNLPKTIKLNNNSNINATGYPSLIVPPNLSLCVLQNFARELGLQSHDSFIVDENLWKISPNIELLELLASRVLFTNLYVNPLKIYQTPIHAKPITEESVFWFLEFYGWI